MRGLISRSLAPCAVLLLAACGAIGGNAEDFAVDAKASPDRVVAALSQVRFEQSEQLFGRLPIARDRPGEGQLGWTIQSSDIPGKPGKPGVFNLRLEPLEGGKATRIHVAISVPPTRMLMGEANKVLSEQKVESAFRTVLERMAKHLGSRGDTAGDAGDLGDLLGAVAVAANTDLQARANQIQRDPQGAFERNMGPQDESREYSDREQEEPDPEYQSETEADAEATT